MSGYRTVRELAELEAVGDGEEILVAGRDLRRWIRQIRESDGGADEERRRCRRIVEDHLRVLLEERQLNPAYILESIIDRIDTRVEE